MLAEFFAQGDRERAAGLAVSPMCDRGTTGRAASQINFIEFVVAPLYAQVGGWRPWQAGGWWVVGGAFSGSGGQRAM